MEPGQRAYEAFCKAAKFDHIPWKTRMPATKAMWAEIEAACLPAAPEDVAGLVERLKKPVYSDDLMIRWDCWRKRHKDGFGGSATRDEFESIIDWIDEERAAAASALQAQAAEIIETRSELIETRAALEKAVMEVGKWAGKFGRQETLTAAAEAKLREAVEVIRRWHMADLTGHDGSLSRARQVSEAFLATMEKTDG